MKRTLLTVSAAFLGAILSGNLYAQPNKHMVYHDVRNKAIDFMPASNQYLLSGNFYPAFVNGWLNNSGYPENIERIQFQLLNSSLNTGTLKTYVSQEEKTLVETSQCPHLSTKFRAEYGKQINGGQFIYCGQVSRDGETLGSCGGSSYNEVFLLRLDNLGNPVWYKRYQIRGELKSVVQTSDGGFMACGWQHTAGTITGDNGFILKTDANGNVQWSKQVQLPAYWDPSLYLSTWYHQIINYQPNRYALVGSTLGGYNNTIVTIIDNAGNFIKNVSYNSAAQPNGDNNILHGTSICTTTDGKLAVCGTAGQMCIEGAKLMVMKIDPATMNLIFLKIYYPTGDPLYEAIGTNIKCVGDRLCITGLDWSNWAGLYAETDLNGILSRYALFGPVDYTAGRFITVNSTLGVPVISGATANNATFVIRNDYNVDCQATDVQRDEESLTYDMLTPRVENLAVAIVNELMFAYDMSFSETMVCEPPPAPFQEGTEDTREGSAGPDRQPGMAMSAPEQMNGSAGTIRIYPNPSSGTIIISHVNGEDVSYEIYAITGQKVASGTASKDHPLDISDLGKGVYIIRTRDASGTMDAIRLLRE